MEEEVWTSGDAIHNQPLAEDPYRRVANERDATIEDVVDKDAVEARAVEEGHANHNHPKTIERSTSSWTSSSSGTNGSSDRPNHPVKEEKRSLGEKLNPFKRKIKPPVPDERTICPEYGANFWSLLTFQWMAPVMEVREHVI